MSILNGLSNDRLLKHLHELVQRDQVLEAELIAHLGELDARRLYLELACPSMFHYCVRVLRFAEGVAYKRIAVARAARKFPEVLVALEEGDLHLTAASLIAPHLEGGKAAEWVALARHRTAQEIKQRIANRKPKADVTSSVRRVPSAPLPAEAGRPNTISVSTPQPQRSKSPTPIPSPERTKARCEPLGAQRFSIRFVADHGVHEQLQELRALLRHSIPDGDMAKILARAVGALLEQVRRQKIGSCSSPRASSCNSSSVPSQAPAKKASRHIPAAIRRAVWARDRGRCSYTSRDGGQCGSSEVLEFHHRVPWARCREHTLSNIALRCRAHNQFEAELDFGIEHMARCRESGSSHHQLDSNPVGDQ
jgi:5-methylcytosine-specific restriction endonuclease McrA